MTYEEGFGEQEYEEPEGVDVTHAPAPYSAPWKWDASTLLWIAGGVLATSFAVWFLMSFTKARALAMVEQVVSNDGTE